MRLKSAMYQLCHCICIKANWIGNIGNTIYSYIGFRGHYICLSVCMCMCAYADGIAYVFDE